jgi:hypothetical protein
MSETKNTPIPWVADLRSGCAAIYPADRSDDTPGCHASNPRNICFSDKGAIYVDGSHWEMDAQNQTDFAHIVRAVNSHEDLVGALSEIVDHATKYGAAPLTATKMFDRARAALAKAKFIGDV